MKKFALSEYIDATQLAKTLLEMSENLRSFEDFKAPSFSAGKLINFDFNDWILDGSRPVSFVKKKRTVSELSHILQYDFSSALARQVDAQKVVYKIKGAWSLNNVWRSKNREENFVDDFVYKKICLGNSKTGFTSGILLGTSVKLLPGLDTDFTFELSYDGIVDFSGSVVKLFKQHVIKLNARIQKEIKYLISQKRPKTDIDWRENFRRIVNVYFKNLDDEHSSVNAYQLLTSIYINRNYNEKKEYNRCYQ